MEGLEGFVGGVLSCDGRHVRECILNDQRVNLLLVFIQGLTSPGDGGGGGGDLVVVFLGEIDGYCAAQTLAVKDDGTGSEFLPAKDILQTCLGINFQPFLRRRSRALAISTVN